MNAEWVGYIAAFFTTVAYIPQTIKVFRHRHTASLSRGMYVMITIGIGMWVVYGLLIGDMPLILANGISLVMVFSILIMKLRHG